MLLNYVKGCKSYKDIKTFDGITYPTFKAACYARGLLDGDKEWIECIRDVYVWATGCQLRQLFVIILLQCEIADLAKLWENTIEF